MFELMIVAMMLVFTITILGVAKYFNDELKTVKD